MKVEDNELVKLNGGSGSISVSLLSYLSSALKTVYSVGQGMGGAIRRIAAKNVCQIL